MMFPENSPVNFLITMLCEFGWETKASLAVGKRAIPRSCATAAGVFPHPTAMGIPRELPPSCGTRAKDNDTAQSYNPNTINN